MDEDDVYDDVVGGYDEEYAAAAYDDEYDVEEVRRSSSRRGGRPSKSRSSSRSSSSSRSDGFEEDDRRSSSSRGSQSQSRGGRSSRGRSSRSMVRYDRGPPRPPPPSAFTRGLTALKGAIPDPAAVRDAAFNAAAAAKESTSKFSSNLYREVKGLTSSELEQVMLKSTKPDDTPVKGKHVERLVGVTYQISGRYDIYDAVLRKLWAKMTESDWRTTMKALYILHRFAADGAPDHQASLKARLRELRRTVDPKRKDKYFNSKQLLAGDSKPDTIKFRAFMGRYSHYVLLRAQCFGGMFSEIGQKPKDKKGSTASTATATAKPITSTNLRAETLDAAEMILKAACACALKEGEVCENTAIAVERVVADLMGLTSATASALTRALSDADQTDLDGALIQKWCQFYSDELLPKTKAMMKRTSPKLDAFGLFLPSRIGASISQDLLEKGLAGQVGTPSPSLEDESPTAEETADDKTENKESVPVDDNEESISGTSNDEQPKRKSQSEEPKPAQKTEDVADDDEYDVYDEYEYDDEEYYDQE